MPTSATSPVGVRPIHPLRPPLPPDPLQGPPALPSVVLDHPWRRGDEAGSWKGLERAGSYMGLSENSVPLNPMVNDHYPY